MFWGAGHLSHPKPELAEFAPALYPVVRVPNLVLPEMVDGTGSAWSMPFGGIYSAVDLPSPLSCARETSDDSDFLDTVGPEVLALPRNLGRIATKQSQNGAGVLKPLHGTLRALDDRALLSFFVWDFKPAQPLLCTSCGCSGRPFANACY